MRYHYTESGLDNVWLEDGFVVENHRNYGELVSISDVRGLHEAIGRWLVNLPRTLTGAEFRYLRVELDLSQKRLGAIVGATEQAIAKWEKARERAVPNRAAERMLRLAYVEYCSGSPEFSRVIDKLTQLDAANAERELRLTRNEDWRQAA